MGEVAAELARCLATARAKRTAQYPGRPSYLLRKVRRYREPVNKPRRWLARMDARRRSRASKEAPQEMSIHPDR
jgi:hypothetical protein